MPNPNAPGSIAAPVIDHRQDEDPTGLMDQMGAVVQLDNVAFNVAKAAFGPQFEESFDPNFDPLADLSDEEKLNASVFEKANSLEEVNQIRKNLLDREEWERQLSAGPLNPFVASMLGGLADPTAYVPLVGASAKSASFGRKLATGALAGGVETATAEAALLALQDGRTVREAAYSAAAGALLGGALSGVGATIGRTVDIKKAATARTELATIMQSTDLPDQGLSLGAAQVESPFTPVRDAEGNDKSKLVGSKVIRTMAAVLPEFMISPSIRLGSSNFATSRALSSSLVDTGMVIDGNLEGLSKGIDLETAIKADGDRALVAVNDVLKQQYQAHKKTSKDPVSRSLWLDRVGRAMRNETSHVDPATDAAAKFLRTNIIDPITNKAQGTLAKDKPLLPEDIPNAKRNNYLTRIWKMDEINARRGELRGIIRGHLERTTEVEDLAEDGGADFIADTIISNLLGHERGRLPSNIRVGVRGPLKEKTFNIPDDLVEGFIENNIHEVMSRYIRTMVADVNTAQRFGEVDATTTIQAKIQEEADVQIARVEKDPAKVKKIQDEADRDKAIAVSLFNQVRGVQATPGDPHFDGLRSFGKAFRTLNFVRLLGGMVLSAVPDVARVAAISGVTPLIRAVLADSARGFKGIRMATGQAKIAGTAADLVLASRAKSMFDFGDQYTGEGKLSQSIDALGTKMGTISGMNHWNTAMKGMTSMMVSSNIAKAVRKLEKGQSLSTAMMTKLARSGIDLKDLQRMADEQGSFVDHAGGVTLLDTASWKNQQLARKIEQALVKDIDNAIITPGKGDAPIWTSTEWGKTLFQFKKFAWAANQRVLIGGLQAGLGARDLTQLSSVATMVSLGIASQSLKDLSKDLEVKERSPEQWAVDAVNASGLIAIAMELDTTLDKATMGTFSAQRALTGDQSSKAAERELLGQLGGPGVGFAEDASSAIGNMFKGDFTQSDVHRIRKLMPFQNLFYMRKILNMAEDGIGEAAGLEKVQKRKSRANKTEAGF